MDYKLTEKEILEIIELYGGSKSTIRSIVEKINSKKIDLIEEDFKYLVLKCTSMHTSIFQKIKSCKTKAERIRAYMSIDDIVDYCTEKYMEERNIGSPEGYDNELFLEYPENRMK